MAYEETVIQELAMHAVHEAVAAVRMVSTNAETTYGLGSPVIDAAMLGLAVMSIEYLHKIGINVIMKG